MIKTRKQGYADLCAHLRDTHGERLTHNAMGATPYLDGAPLSDTAIGRMREQVEREHGLEFSHDNIRRALCQIAAERPFHPVERYLRKLVWDGMGRIELVAEEILHLAPSPLVQSTIRGWFVSAVARPFHPGCSVDEVLILCGKQGLRKSMFFEVLGGEWFCSINPKIATGRGRRQLTSGWICEWAEPYTITLRRDVRDIEALIMATHDKFVPPYARGAINHPRSTIIAGTSTWEDPLDDLTGSRRFRVLEVGHALNIPLLRAWRDQLWAEAVHGFDMGEHLADG